MNRPVLWFGLGMVVMLALVLGGVFAVRLALADTQLRLMVDGDIDVVLQDRQPPVTITFADAKTQEAAFSTSTQAVTRATPSIVESPEDAEPGLSPTLRTLDRRDGGIRNALWQLYEDLIPTVNGAQATVLPTLNPGLVRTATSTLSPTLHAIVGPTGLPTTLFVATIVAPEELDEVVAATATILPRASATRRAPIVNTIVPPTAERPESVATITPEPRQRPTGNPVHPPIVATHVPTHAPPSPQPTAVPIETIGPTQSPKVETLEPTEPAHETPKPPQPPKVETPEPTEPAHDTPKPPQPPKVETPRPTQPPDDSPKPTRPPRVETPESTSPAPNTPRPIEPTKVDIPKPTDIPPATRVPETAVPAPTVEPTHESESHETPQATDSPEHNGSPEGHPTEPSHSGHGHGQTPEPTQLPKDTPRPAG